MKKLMMIALSLGVVACGPPSPEAAADRCEERARAAQGPEVGVRMGVNSDGDAFGGVSLGLSVDALQGRDPLEVYEDCVINLTGQPPIRPPQLRDI